jgi:type IX secretion system PorP/SprF family membrane protein
MREVKKLWLAVFTVTIASVAQAQYFQYSQYNFTSQRINPAMIASSDYASLGMIYRNQSAASDIQLKSSMLSAAYPLLSRKTGMRWSGIGISAMDDRSGGIFSVQEAALTYGINVFLNRYQTLSLGFKGLYQQRKINLDGLFTGSQFIPDRGFDQTISNGETIDFLQSSFFTFSSGVYWQQTDKKGNRIGYWGLSIFDFNKPEDSFSGGTSQLNSTMIFNGGMRIYQQDQLSVTPEVLFTRSNATNAFNIGFITGYNLNKSSRQAAERIDIITKYVVNRSAILGLQWHRENISLGVSYDFPFVTRNAANFNTIEVALELRRLIDPRLKRKTTAKKKTPPKNQVAQKTVERKPVVKAKPVVKDSLKQTVTTQTDLKTTLKHKQDSALATAKVGTIKHEPLELERVTLHFNFEFNSSDLDEESRKFLDDLTAALTENAHLKIKLTGHTDNVGSAKFNERLSLFRANSIKEYLSGKGIDAARIQTEGKGLAEPLNDNKTEADRAKNRRVELVILYED